LPSQPACLNSWAGAKDSNVGAAIASTTTIAITCFLTHITGTAAITTITPPNPDFQGMVILVADAAFTTVTTGNIAIALTGVAKQAIALVYDGTSWYPVKY